MKEPLTKSPAIGEVIEFISESTAFYTKSRKYTIISIDEDGDAEFMNDQGKLDYVSRSDYPRFTLVDGKGTDPGYIQVLEVEHESSDCYEVTIEVNERMLDKLYEMERNHRKASEKARIQAQIDDLQKKLKEL